MTEDVESMNTANLLNTTLPGSW